MLKAALVKKVVALKSIVNVFKLAFCALSIANAFAAKIMRILMNGKRF
jgi:hypothetical protein